ncbi:MAG: accessory gene regulator B family protein [Ruminococcus sp.]|nr:accessory gene regulator B family protein [Ruminococcus sp.]
MKVAEKLADSLEENEIIKHDDRELYVYGLDQGFSIILNIITTLLIGLIFNTFFQLVVFMAAYIPLRSFAGGYHAKTPLRCYIFSIVMLVFVSLGMKNLVFRDVVNYVVLAISAFIIFVLSPVEDKNKPLDKIELKVYRKRTLLILLAELIICVLFNVIDLHAVFISINYNLAVMSIIILLGMLKSKLSRLFLL